MEVLIALIAGLIAVALTALQAALILVGLSALVHPIISKKQLGWFALWGAWHFTLFLLLVFKFDWYSSEATTFLQVAFQLDGIRIMITYLMFPLLMSFIISRIHLYVRNQ